MVEEELQRIPSKGWAAMIRKVYEVDQMICPQCGGVMKVVAFLTEYAVVDRIIDHLGLKFVADKPLPSNVAFQKYLMAAEDFSGSRKSPRIRPAFSPGRSFVRRGGP